MSAVALIVASAEDRWPADRRACRTTRSARCSWPRTCSAPTAPWRTSAAATRRPRARRPTTSAARSTAMWVKGSGSDLATMEGGALHAAAARGDAAAARARRDDRRGHGRLPRALPDRSGGAALVDRDAAARVRPGRARPPHPSRRRSTSSPAPRDGERLDRRVLRRRGRVDPLHPARLHARQAGRRGGARQPRTCKLVVLAKHGLVVWGDTAEEAYQRDDRGDQPGRRVRQRSARRGDVGGSAALPAVDRRRGAAARGAAGAPRGGVQPSARRCWSSTLRRGRSSSSPRARRRTLADGGRRVPGPPRAHQARAAVGRLRSGVRGRGRRCRADRARCAGGVPRRVPRVLRELRRRRRPSRATPTRASC